MMKRICPHERRISHHIKDTEEDLASMTEKAILLNKKDEAFGFLCLIEGAS